VIGTEKSIRRDAGSLMIIVIQEGNYYDRVI